MKGLRVQSGALPIKKIILLFLATLVVYLGVFYFVEYQRTRNGPWVIHFLSTSGGQPMIRIEQPAFGIEGLELVFEQESLPEGFSESVARFDDPVDFPYPITFGEVIFQDLTFQPGTLTLNLFDGHEVELIRRTLFVDKKEVPWTTSERVKVLPAEKLPYLSGQSTNQVEKLGPY